MAKQLIREASSAPRRRNNRFGCFPKLETSGSDLDPEVFCAWIRTILGRVAVNSRIGARDAGETAHTFLSPALGRVEIRARRAACLISSFLCLSQETSQTKSLG